MAPEKQFRIGLVSASVFVNEVNGEGGKRTVRSVNVQRRYCEGDGDWKSATTFGLSDLPAAIRVMPLAQQHVEEQEASL